MSGFKKIFLRPARKPFWESQNGDGGELRGIMVLLAGLLFCGIAYAWSVSIIERGRGLVGNLAGEGDWFWVYAEVTLKTGLLWIIGGGALLIGLVQVLILLTAKGAQRIAKSVMHKTEKGS